MSIHGWTTPTGPGFCANIDAVGLNCQWLEINPPTDIRIQLFSQNLSGGPCTGGPFQIQVGNLSTPFVNIRFNHHSASGGVVGQNIDTVQAWDINGNQFFNQSCTYTGVTGSNSSGATAHGGGIGQNVDYAYIHVYTTDVADNARPPVTADTTTNSLLYWQFDGTLNDGSGNGYTGVISSGSPSYLSTPGQTLVVPKILSMLAANQPAINAILDVGYQPSWKTSAVNQLDGTLSYSQADGSPNVTCAWSFLSGPTTPTLTNLGTCTPTTNTSVNFGDYNVQLVATDVAANTGTGSVHIGAVNYDSNGVVTTGNSFADSILGPMIAFGKNPWGFQDYFALHATVLRNGDYANTVSSQNQTYPGWSTVSGSPQWEKPGGGTVSYYFNCTGNPAFCTATGTTLNGSCSATSTSCVVNDATKIDTTALPTRVIIWDGTNWDEDRLCSVSTNTLNWCYDPSALPRHTFSSGVNVIQSKVIGSSTHFLTDATAPVCPDGAPGLPGVVSYSTGTVSVTAGSTSIVGSGTTWDAAHGVIPGNFIRISATHSATPFFFMAQISSVGSTVNITSARAFPSDGDTASGLSYSVLPASRTMILHSNHATDTSGDGLIGFGTTGCESETEAYLNPLAAGLGNSFFSGHDISALNGTHQTGKQYAITDTTGWINEGSTGGINFYGEDLAHWALYFRSGLSVALNAARTISNYWIRSPWGNADGNGFPRLFLGGGGVGAFLSATADGSSNVSWSDLRGYAAMGVQMVNGIMANGCNSYDDTRDTGWAYGWLILAAIYDPDTTSMAAPGGIPWRTYWQNNLAQMHTNDTNCERSDHSWSNGFIFTTLATNALTLTNNSTVVTGTAIPSSLCAGTTSGNGTVSNGSATLTATSGSIPVQGSGMVLVINGTLSGSPFTGSYSYSGSGGSASLSVLWPGDTGSVTWLASGVTGTNNNALMSIGTNNDDTTDLAHNFACTWNSSTSITLDHAWPGSSGSTYHAYAGNLSGYGQQPFMLGIKALSMNYLASQTVPAIASYVSPYTQFTKDAAGWLFSTGYDSNTQGTNYGRVFGFCEPFTTAVGNFETRTPGCNYGLTSDAIVAARELNAEIGTGAALYYQYTPTAPNKTWADTVYGSLWGTPQYNTGGVYNDGKSPAANLGLSNMLDAYINAGKWTGFFLGAGMSHRWPAMRVAAVPALGGAILNGGIFNGVVIH